MRHAAQPAAWARGLVRACLDKTCCSWLRHHGSAKAEVCNAEDWIARLGCARCATRHSVLVRGTKLPPPAGASDNRAILIPVEGVGAQMAITKVSSQADDHQRHHLDLYASDQVAEIERLIDLGAQRVDWRYPDGADYIVLADPDGNRFCVVRKSRF